MDVPFTLPSLTRAISNVEMEAGMAGAVPL